MPDKSSPQPRRQSFKLQFEEFLNCPGEAGVAATAVIILAAAMYSHHSGNGVQQSYVAKKNPAEIISERVSDGAPLSDTNTLPEALRGTPSAQETKKPIPRRVVPVVTVTVRQVVTQTKASTVDPTPTGTELAEPTATHDPTVTPTANPGADPTATPDPTAEPTNQPSATPTGSTPTPTATATPTIVPEPSATPKPSATTRTPQQATSTTLPTPSDRVGQNETDSERSTMGQKPSTDLPESSQVPETVVEESTTGQ